MEVVSLKKLKDVKLIIPKIFKDERGYFYESYNDLEFKNKVCNTTFIQDNQSLSAYGTLRGLHWQRPPYAQSKLVRVVRGAVFDIAVDIRIGSPTFGVWDGAYLSAENNSQLFIPRGFAHGFIAMNENTVFQYKCDNFYNKESEAAIAYNSIDIDWNFIVPTKDIILSDKDKLHPTLDTISKDKLFDYNTNYYE